MAVHLINIRDLPDDEHLEIRQLLEAHGIEFYETQPSWWGLGMGGIWLRDETQAAEARQLLGEYQRQRSERARAEYAERKRAGTAETLGDKLRHSPLKLLLLVAGLGVILYFSIVPFFGLGG